MIDILSSYATQFSEYWFGKPVTFEEKLANIKIELKKTKREIEKDKLGMEIEIDMQKQDIQTEKSKNPNITSKELDRFITKIVRLQSRIGHLEANLTKIDNFESMLMNVKTQTQMTKAFMQLGQAMTMMSRQINASQILQMLKQYEYEQTKMETLEDTINTATEQLFDLDAEETDITEMRSKILDELGIQLNEELPLTPQNKKGKEALELEVDEFMDDESKAMLERIQALK